jgi:ABC-type uncharacterized transport system substrate-binding protein
MKRINICIAVLSLAFLISCSEPEKKVFLAFSYHPEYEWAKEEMEGVNSVFKGKSIITESFYLDTKRHTDREWKESVSAEALRKIDFFSPDVVIVFDDNACELVAKKLVGTDMPVIFCGMNKNPEDYGFPEKNVTGVTEIEHPVKSMAFLREIVPGIEKIVMMNDDSPTSKGFISKMMNQEKLPDDLEIHSTNNYAEWKDLVLKNQQEGNALALFSYFTIKDESGTESVEQDSVLLWTLENSRLPECAIFDFTVTKGALCGVTSDGFTQGKMAADMALEVLNGKIPEEIPVVTPHKGKYVVNGKRARELGLTLPDDLPEKVWVIE